MDGQAVKGELFNSVLDQVRRRWGMHGVEEARVRPDEYADGEWYGLSEFCRLLEEVKTGLGNKNPLTVYQLGFGSVKDDERWKATFEDMDPAKVFLGSERQEEQYRVGTLSAETVGPKHVRLDYSADGAEPVWFDFYRGRLQGVLELTGRTGVVHMRPRPDGTSRMYDVKWG